MKASKITIYSSKDSICNVAYHFEENWLKAEKLHPAGKLKHEIIKDAEYDAIFVLDEAGNPIFSLKDTLALRLDKLQNFLININRL